MSGGVESQADIQSHGAINPKRDTGILPTLRGNNVASVIKASRGSPASLEFLAAVNDSITATADPHPVQARNVGLVQAWQRWSALREGRNQSQSEADRIIAHLGQRFDENVALVEETMRNDPIWKMNVLAAPSALASFDNCAVFATAPLMFWRRPHVLIELTPALQQLLESSDLGSDIPINLLRPPAPACYIRFGEAMQRAIMPPQPKWLKSCHIEGVYVFESVRREQRAIAMVAVYNLGEHPTLGITTIDIVVDDEQKPLVGVIQQICANKLDHEGQLHRQALAQVCTKIFLYWNVEQARRFSEAPYSDAIKQLARVGPKKTARLGRHAGKLYDRVLLGPSALPGHVHGMHGDVAPHWRRGHFRMQPHGPHQSLRKVIFIAPTLVRADRLD